MGTTLVGNEEGDDNRLHETPAAEIGSQAKKSGPGGCLLRLLLGLAGPLAENLFSDENLHGKNTVMLRSRRLPMYITRHGPAKGLCQFLELGLAVPRNRRCLPPLQQRSEMRLHQALDRGGTAIQV